MNTARRHAGAKVLVGAAAYALAFAQRPGWATADTKINLHVDPGRFLADAASMWTSTGSLGGVQAAQQTGYLFPMGPFFALGHAFGIQDWIVQRLWLGTVLAIAGWGAMALLRTLLRNASVSAVLTAGAAMLLNPFVVTYANRTTVTFLAYAVLPWLMLAVHHGVRDPRRWRWPATAALLVAASGGGVNGAVTAWMLLGPALLLVYEPFLAEVGWRDVGAFIWRAVVLGVLVSLWWIIPAYIQSHYGIDFLHFTEQPGTVWGTTSLTETLRLMSFWLSYVGIGFTGTAIPYFDDSRTLLFSAPVVVASLLVPALALVGFVWTRRWRYGPFLLGLALVALLVMGAGFPDGTPLRHGLYFAYNHFPALRFLRASYKAAPLLALAVALLAGAAAGEAWKRAGAWGRAFRFALRTAGALACLALLVASAWPLVRGRAQDSQVSYRAVPAAWQHVASDIYAKLPADARALVLPGDLFSFYNWGGTVDPILPALTNRPVAERAEVPYADLRSTDMLWTIDGLVHQQRLLPGELAPLLSLIAVRQVVTGTDDDLARSDAPAPADAAAVLAGQGLTKPNASYGPASNFAPTTALGPAVSLPQVRRYDIPTARGLIRVEPRAAPVVLDGSASGIAELAAFGALPADRSLLYAADQTPAQLRSMLSRGAQLVITDSNRRAAFPAGTLDQNAGPVLTPSQTVSADGMILDPFGGGSNDQTVATYTGISSVTAPASPQVAQFPEHAPFAAVDGSTATSWLADPTLGPSGRVLTVSLVHPIDVPSVNLLTASAGTVVTQVQVNGRPYAVGRGWNTLRLGLRSVSSLTVAITRTSPASAGAATSATGPALVGIRELRIPGVTASQSLRLPIDATNAVAGQKLDTTALTYLFSRQTGDDPYARDLSPGAAPSLNVHSPGDAEVVMRRVFVVPAARSFDASAWVAPFAQTSDATLDGLAGYRGPVVATSSSRFAGEPRYRASSALDGDPSTAWIGDWVPGSTASLSVKSPKHLTVSKLTLLAPQLPVRFPTVVRVSWPGGSTPPLRVSSRNTVSLGHVIHTRSFTLQILDATALPGATAAEERAVGIAEIDGIGGLRPFPPAPTTGPFTTRCGIVALTVGGQPVVLRVQGSAAAFENGTPMRASDCGPRVALPAGTTTLAVSPGPFAVDALRLYSRAPRGTRAAAIPGGGNVLNAGTAGRDSYDGVRVSVHGPSWLVLSDSYDRGWRAYCNGRSLGTPIPIDGYANAWPVERGCTNVSFSFAPNKLARLGYIISGAALILCLLLILTGRHRRPPPERPIATRARRAAERATRTPPPAPAPVGAAAPRQRVTVTSGAWPPRRAIIAAVPAAFVFGFVFGIVPGLLSLPVIFLILWRAIGARTLTLAAAALLLIAVPALYLLHTGPTSGGNHFGYAAAHLGAHYAGVAAFGLLAAALWRSLVDAIAGGAARPAPAPAESIPAGPPAAAPH